MAFGKASFALLCLGTLALINYTNAACSILPNDNVASQIDDTATPGSVIQTFTATVQTADFVVGTGPIDTSAPELATLYAISYYLQDAKNAIITLSVGPGLAEYLDNGGEATFKPAFTFDCPDTVGTPLTPHAEWAVHVNDKNSRNPEFVNLQPEITFQLSTWTAETNLLNSKPFIVKDLDATAANQKVTVSLTGGIAANITVEQANPEPNANKESEFNLKLNEGITAGHHNVTIVATNTGVAAGDEQRFVEQTISIIVNGSMQQAGAFVMVTLLSVVATFFGKY